MTNFYPPITGRSTSQLNLTRLLFQIHHDQSAIQGLQTQLSTGRRITRPSEDPSAALRALTIQRQLEFKQQTSRNLRSADTNLSLTEGTLAQAQDILNQIRGMAVQASSNTLSSSEKEAFTAEVQAAISTLVELGNAKFRDQYLFSGSNPAQAPFTLNENSITFSGDDGELRTFSDLGATLAANVSAEEAFGVRSEEVVSSVDLDPALTPRTPLALLNRGQGISPGAIQISDGDQIVEVDLSSAYDLRDVIEQLNALEVSGRSISASVSDRGINVEYQDGLGGTLRIDEVGTGDTAASLGIYNYSLAATSPVVGSDLDPIVTPETRLSQLFQRAGLQTTESFQISQGEHEVTVSLQGAETVEDLIERIDTSGANVTATIDPTGKSLSIQNRESGTRMSIGEAGGGLATQLGIRTLHPGTRLSELNDGRGVNLDESNADLVLVRTDGSELRIDLDGATDVGDVLARINNNVDNFAAGMRITASVATHGNGLVLSAPAGSQPLQVRVPGGAQAAWDLGLVPKGATEVSGVLQAGNSVIGGQDVSGVAVEGVFTTLVALREAIVSEQVEEMPRIVDLLDQDLQRLALSRGRVGTRQQDISRMQDLTAEQQLWLTQMESDELDADLAKTISDLAAREAALQASLNLMGQASRLTLFDYL